VRSIVRPDAEIVNAARLASAASIQSRLTSLPLPDRLKSIDASIDSGIVTLRGSVATESDKRVVERVLMLEPGVDSVRNELVVRSKPAEQIEAQKTP
jgi:hypothetical protein